MFQAFLIPLVIALSIITFFRGFSMESLNMKRYFNGYYNFYLFPLLLLVKIRIQTIVIILKDLLLYAIIAFAVLILTLGYWKGNELLFEIFSKTFGAISGFLLLFQAFLKTKKVFIANLIATSFLFINVALARRAESFYFFSLLLVSHILVISLPSKKFIANKIQSYILILAFIILLVFSYSFNSKVFLNLLDRFNEGFDNRELVFEELVYDLTKTNSWIFGKGSAGVYSSAFLDYKNEGEREGIENGFLNVILKSGLIYLIAFLILSFYSIIKGLFFSKNTFTKTLAMFIIIYIISMFGFGVPEFILRYLFLWFSISLCLNNEIRKMDDHEIRLLFSHKY
jgi:hypothetical protein